MEKKKKTISFFQKIKRKNKQNVQRYRKRKPVFRRIFFKRLALFLCIGLLIALIGTQTAVHLYRKYSSEAFDATWNGPFNGVQNIYNRIYEGNAKEPDEQEYYWGLWKSTVKLNFLVNNGLGRDRYCFALYDGETGEIIVDTTPTVFIKLPSEKHAYHACPMEVMQEAIRDDTVFGEDVELCMDDVYIKNGDFIPGKVRLVKSHYEDTGNIDADGESYEPMKVIDTVLKEYDYTPEDTTGYSHIFWESDEMFGPIWGPEDGNLKAKKALERSMEESLDELDNYSNAHVSGSDADYVAIREVTLGDKQFYFAGVAHFDLFEDYTLQVVLTYVGIALAMLILAFVISYRTYMVEQGHFRMEQYRRETTNAMAHDLKTPLTAISGYAESLRDNVHPEKKDYYADAIFENVQHMNRLVENILELAKVEDVNRKPELVEVDLRKITENILKKYEILTVDKKLEFDVQGDAVIRADADMIAQAVENLISNVVKYALEDTVVHVVVRKEGYEIRNAIKGELDVGAEELWKPFVKGSNSRTETQGTGTGLTIVKNIVELHGFRFTLACEGEEFVAKITTCL